jgi:peptidase S41-like protein
MTIRTIVIVIVLLAFAPGATGAGSSSASDIRNLVDEIEQRHPNPYHAISRAEFRGAAEDLATRAPSPTRSEQIVGVMRLMHMLGERDGHSGVFPFIQSNLSGLHAYPIRLWRFPEGLHVIRAQDPGLVGARVVSVGGLSAAEVEARVRPLVPRDNEWSLLDHLPYFLVTAEVLEGIGVGAAPAWELELRDGTRRQVVLERISNAEYASTLLDSWWQLSRKAPLFIRLSHIEYGISVIDRGRVLYVSYNHVTQPGLVPQRLVRLAKRKRVRKIVVDLRMNGGGNNTTYYDLVQALRNRRINRPDRLAVLIGRRTFSAAGNFAADVDRMTRARFYGEPTGGAPSQWGDRSPIPLPSLGIESGTAIEYVGDPSDTRVATMPQVSVEMTAADWFAGRDPILAAALR